ncbi:MAG: hypothetical protein ACOY0T_16265 [Myxococcota bacterium]
MKLLVAAIAFAAICACNVENTTPDTGGVGGLGGSGACPSGVSVMLSDYASSQVALSTLAGETLSRSFMSTGSAKTDGLSFALSGDVVLPSTRNRSNRVVLIDRFGTNVLTWADPESGKVLGQLAVGTGFESNPSDYLELDDGTAFVSRFGQNNDPGQQPFDDGGDLLVIDSERREIVDSVVFEASDGLPPRPTGMTRVGNTVLVSLGRVSLDFSSTGESELAGVSVASHEIEFRVRYAGLKSCGRATPSPSGKLLAVACSGRLDTHGTVASVEESALVLLDAQSMPPRELRRLPAVALAAEPIQNGVVFASESLLLFKTQTSDNGVANNRWLALNLASGDVTTLLQASPDAQGKGRGLLYGAMSCSPGCSDICLLADADLGVLQRVRITPNKPAEMLTPVVVDAESGLPPRDLVER